MAGDKEASGAVQENPFSALEKEIELFANQQTAEPPVAAMREELRTFARDKAKHELTKATIKHRQGQIGNAYSSTPLSAVIKAAMGTGINEVHGTLGHLKAQYLDLQVAIGIIRNTQLSKEIKNVVDALGTIPQAMIPQELADRVHSTLTQDVTGSNHQLSTEQVKILLAIPRNKLTLETAAHQLYTADYTTRSELKPHTHFTEGDLILARSAMASYDQGNVDLGRQMEQLKEPRLNKSSSTFLRSVPDMTITIDTYVSREQLTPGQEAYQKNASLAAKAAGIWRRATGKQERAEGPGAGRGAVRYYGFASMGYSAKAEAGKFEDLAQAATALVTDCALRLQQKGMTVEVLPPDKHTREGAPPDLMVNNTLKLRAVTDRLPYMRYDLTVPLREDSVAMADALKPQLALLKAVIPVAAEAVAYAARPATAQAAPGQVQKV